MHQHLDYYREHLPKNIFEEYFEQHHLDHCVEAIRQSLMYHGDISLVVWQYAEDVQHMRIYGNVVHSCRNFEKLREWLRERSLETLGLKLDFDGNWDDPNLKVKQI
jgi:hypothetical protein